MATRRKEWGGWGRGGEKRSEEKNGEKKRRVGDEWGRKEE
jgi:hypothetical protein